jgi:hypothetical protein
MHRCVQAVHRLEGFVDCKLLGMGSHNLDAQPPPNSERVREPLIRIGYEEKTRGA